MRRPEGPHLYDRGGWWWTRYQVAGRRRHYSTGERDRPAAAARAGADWARAHASAGLPVPRTQAGELTDVVASYVADIEERAAERHDGYAATHEQHLRDYLLRRFARLEAVTAATWLDAVRAFRRRQTKYKRPPSWSTLQRVTVTVRRFLAWCVEHGYLAEAPRLRAPERKLAEADARPRRALTVSERNRIFAKLSGEARRWYAVAFYSALRLGAVSAMTRRWVDFRRACIIVPARWSKNRQATEIDLHPKAAAAVRAQFRARGRIDPDAPLWTEASHRRAWRTAILAAKVDPYGLTPHHTARHTRLTQIGARGELLAVMSQAGHMSPQTAQKYLHASLEHARRGNRRAP